MLPYVCAAFAVTLGFSREVSVESEEESVPPSVCAYISIVTLLLRDGRNLILARDGFEKPFDNIR